MANFATSCVQDLIAKINAVPEIKKHTVQVYDQVALLNKTKAINPPFAGVIYDGMFSNHQKGKVGSNATLQCSIMLAESGQSLHPLTKGKDSIAKDKSTELLDDIRDCIRLTKSPTGHSWEFVSEEIMPFESGLFFYLQRWQTTAILTQV